jgi:hypothetical protein
MYVDLDNRIKYYAGELNAKGVGFQSNGESFFGFGASKKIGSLGYVSNDALVEISNPFRVEENQISKLFLMVLL